MVSNHCSLHLVCTHHCLIITVPCIGKSGALESVVGKRHILYIGKLGRLETVVRKQKQQLIPIPYNGKL